VRGVVLGTGGIRRDSWVWLALNWAAVAIVGIGLGPILGPAIQQLAADHDLDAPSRPGAVRCVPRPDATCRLRDVGRICQQIDVVVEPDACGDRVDRVQHIAGGCGEHGPVGLRPAGLWRSRIFQLSECLSWRLAWGGLWVLLALVRGSCACAVEGPAGATSACWSSGRARGPIR
jgi:hypothetical protein